MTPIWQAECPQSAEEASDDLWQAAFEAWPLQEDFHRAPSQIVRLLGLPKELVPSLSQAVCSARQFRHPGSLKHFKRLSWHCTSILQRL